MNRLRLLVIASLAVLAAVSLTACGNKKDVERFAANEGIYFDAGNLKYQVQNTRQLNPTNAFDSELMMGIAPKVLAKRPDELWFATFLRVENETGNPQLRARNFVIRDTNGDKFYPVAINPAANSFAYTPGLIAANSAYPNINSIPGQTDLNGKMLLFKIPRQAIALRPLTLTVFNQLNPTTSGAVHLDI
jgi:hypothetical protein